MIPDPTDEIGEIKRKLSEKFGNDVHRIIEDARRRQSESGRRSVTVAGASQGVANTASAVIPPSGGGTPADSEDSTPAVR